MNQNPYNPTRPARARVFIGRVEMKRRLTNGLQTGGMCYSLMGSPGMGKTSLLWAVQQELSTQHADRELVVPLPFYVECLRRHQRVEEILVSIVESLVTAFEMQRGLHCPASVQQHSQTRAEGGQDLESILKPLLDWAFDQEKRRCLPILLLDNLHRICESPLVAYLASFLQTVVNHQQLSLVVAGQRALTEELRNDVSPLRLLIAHHSKLEPFTRQETHELVAKAAAYGWPVEKDCADVAYQLTKGHPYRLHYYLLGALSSEERLTVAGLQTLHTPETERHLDTVLGEPETERYVQAPGLDAEIVTELRNLVREDHLEAALDALSSLTKYQLHADLLVHRLNRINSQEQKGTIHRGEVNAERSGIAEKILRLISSKR